MIITEIEISVGADISDSLSNIEREFNRARIKGQEQDAMWHPSVARVIDYRPGETRFIKIKDLDGVEKTTAVETLILTIGYGK